MNTELETLHEYYSDILSDDVEHLYFPAFNLLVLFKLDSQEVELTEHVEDKNDALSTSTELYETYFNATIVSNDGSIAVV